MFLYFLKCIPSYQFLKNVVLPGKDILSDRGHWPEMNSKEIHEEKKSRCFLGIKKDINTFQKRGSKREKWKDPFQSGVSVLVIPTRAHSVGDPLPNWAA